MSGRKETDEETSEFRSSGHASKASSESSLSRSWRGICMPPGLLQARGIELQTIENGSMRRLANEDGKGELACMHGAEEEIIVAFVHQCPGPRLYCQRGARKERPDIYREKAFSRLGWFWAVIDRNSFACRGKKLEEIVLHVLREMQWADLLTRLSKKSVYCIKQRCMASHRVTPFRFGHCQACETRQTCTLSDFRGILAFLSV